MNKIKPLYIWAGGKNKLITKYKNNPGIPLSGYSTYVEPFLGGGAMLLYVYQNNPNVTRFIVNDANAEIMNIYDSIKYNVKDFISEMNTLEKKYIPLSKAERKAFYYNLRTKYTKDYQKWGKVKESAVLYFLMKTGFNGIWQTNKESNGRFATPSGLLNQKTNVYDKINVLEWNKLLQKVDLFCGDWKDCVSSVKNAFFFLDPPYRDCFTSYGQSFTDKDQEECISFCIEKSKNNTVMLCNKDVGDGFFESKKHNLNTTTYDVTHTAGRRKQTKDENGTVNYSAKQTKEILLHNIATVEICSFIEDCATV